MLATLDVPYIDTRAADLVWTLDHPVLPALTMATAPVPGGTLELRVLGASHQVVLRGGDGDIVETVACLPGHSPYLPATIEHRIAGRRYRFRAAVEQVAAAEVSARANDLRAMASQRADAPAVVAAFPAAPDAVTALAVSSGRAQGHVHGVGWRTWHVYPNSSQVVTTSTEVVR